MSDFLDAGEPPELDPDAPTLEEEQQAAAAAIARDETPVVSAEQIEEVFDFAGQLLNMAATSRGGGPEDVYTFTEKELRLLGRAGESYVNRHARLAAVAEKSDVIIIGGVTFKMLKRETGRYRAHRAAQDAGSLADERIDVGIRPEST